MTKRTRILITGAGGVGGVNFARALRFIKNYFLLGIDNNFYHHVFPPVDVMLSSLPHIHDDFMPNLLRLVKDYNIDFIHPQPTLEALVLAKEKENFVGWAKTYLPSAEAMELGFDKYKTAMVLKKHDVRVPELFSVKTDEEIRCLFKERRSPFWIRARTGAGGRLSLSVETPEEMIYWMRLWKKKRHLTDGGRLKPVMERSDWLVQEYIKGQDIAWDGLFFNGLLVTSFTRERIQYPFKNQLPSGVGGTPSVCRIINNPKVNNAAKKTVSALDSNPHGFYCVDFKVCCEPYVTEVNIGKAHTTLPLWGYAMRKALDLPWYANMADLYVRLGIGEWNAYGEWDEFMPQFDLYPTGFHLIRHIDCGTWLWRPDGYKEKVL